MEVRQVFGAVKAMCGVITVALSLMLSAVELILCMCSKVVNATD